MLVTISDKELNRINIIQAVSEKGLLRRYPNRPNWSKEKLTFNLLTIY